MITEYRYICSRCAIGWHYTPYCPYSRPEPRPITPGRMNTLRYLNQLEREGRLEPVQPLDLRWLWLVPPALVIFLLLMLL